MIKEILFIVLFQTGDNQLFYLLAKFYKICHIK